MSIVAVVWTIIKLVLVIVETKLERDKEKKKIRQEAIKEIENGIKKNDASSITLAFDRINRTRL